MRVPTSFALVFSFGFLKGGSDVVRSRCRSRCRCRFYTLVLSLFCALSVALNRIVVYFPSLDFRLVSVPVSFTFTFFLLFVIGIYTSHSFLCLTRHFANLSFLPPYFETFLTVVSILLM